MTSAVRKSFARDVLRLPLVTVQHYWVQQAFSGRAEPPAVRLTDDAVLEFVARNPGAVGYVSADAPLGPGVKAIPVVEE